MLTYLTVVFVNIDTTIQSLLNLTVRKAFFSQCYRRNHSYRNLDKIINRSEKILAERLYLSLLECLISLHCK